MHVALTRFVDLEQASRELNVPASWLRSEALAGRLPFLRAGNRLLFHLDSVEQRLVERALRTVTYSSVNNSPSDGHNGE